MSNDETAEAWRLPGWILWTAALSPAILNCVAWIWFFTAWKVLPDVRWGTVEQQKRAIFWAADLPFDVFAGSTIVIMLFLAVVLIARGHGWLAVPLCLYYLIAVFVMVVGAMMWVPFKPPGS